MPKKNLYTPESDEPFPLSRAKMQLFHECPRCFYLDQRLGVARPPDLPFTLNDAVDKLMKSEFDAHREPQATGIDLPAALKVWLEWKYSIFKHDKAFKIK